MSKTIGIFCAGQAGDCMTISSVLKYKNELWGEDAKIVWYISNDNKDLLKHQDIEIREFPRGYGYPQMVLDENAKLIEQGKEPIWEDWQPLVDKNNHMNLELKSNYPSLADIDFGYFPAPHQISVQKRHGWEYAICSKKVFGINDDLAWHPVLKFSEEEIREVNEFWDKIFLLFFNPKGKVVAIESFAGSGQSKISDIQIINSMDICKRIYPDCNFIFMSHKFVNGNEKFPEGLTDSVGITTASHFTVRQCALVVGKCDLLISVSSGIAVASSCWGNHPTPIIQLCGSLVCSTKLLSLGRFELITTDDKTPKDWWNEFEMKLIQILNDIK